MSKENLNRLFSRATNFQLKAGLDHYNYLHNFAHQISVKLGISLERAAAMVAVISPLTNWEDMLGALTLYVKYGPPVSHGLPRNREKLIRISQGAIIQDNLRGQKVTAFWQNIVNPQDGNYITVDGHMMNAWCGSWRRLSKVRNLTSSVYQKISEDTRIVAGAHGVFAPQAQAVIWIVWRDLPHTRVSLQQLPLFRDLAL